MTRRPLPGGDDFGPWLEAPKGRVARLNRAAAHQRAEGSLGVARLQALLEMVRDRPAYVSKFATYRRIVRMMLRDRGLTRDQLEALARAAGGHEETALRYLRDPRVDRAILHRIFDRGDTWPNYLDALFERVRWPERVAWAAGDCADHTRLQPHHLWKIRAADPRTSPEDLAGLLGHATLDLPVIRTILSRTEDRTHPDVRTALRRKAELHRSVLEAMLADPLDRSEETALFRAALDRHPEAAVRHLERRRRLPDRVDVDALMPLIQSPDRNLRERVMVLLPTLRASALREGEKGRLAERTAPGRQDLRPAR